MLLEWESVQAVGDLTQDGELAYFMYMDGVHL